MYRITPAQEQELTQLGRAILDCLRALAEIAVIVYGPRRSDGRAWTLIRNVLSTGVPGLYQELQGMREKEIPRLLKVDLMVDADGAFKIAEIDGHNKHGLGYSTLAKRFREALYPDAPSLPGAIKLLADEIRRQGHDTLKLLYGDQERFYKPEFEIAIQELAREGISCELMAEAEADANNLRTGLFLDLPFLFRRANELYPSIIAAYKAGDVEFVIPPKPCLGSKGVLALLRNDGEDKHLEAILRAFTRPDTLELVRRYIPETVLVDGRAHTNNNANALDHNHPYVLKEVISSGMHGTIFSSDPTFRAALQRARESRANWIMQREIVNQPQTFAWYEADGTLQKTHDWFMRVTVQYVGHKPADVIVTARRDKAVHGGKDCLQLGTVIAD